MRHHYHLLPFSPAGVFVWNRTLTHHGEIKRPGDPVNNSAFTPVRLRQLFERRMIIPAPFDGPAPAYLDNGRGEADRVAAQLAKEECDAVDETSAEDTTAPAETGTQVASGPARKSAAPRTRAAAKTAPAAKRAGVKKAAKG